jgi:hypothetical protein
MPSIRRGGNGWPVLDLSAGIADEAFENRIMAIPFQVLLLGPLLAAGVAAGWWRQLRGRALRDTRFISVGFVLLINLLIVTAEKPHYAAGALPALTAIAAVQLVDWSRRHRSLVAGAVGANGLVTAAIDRFGPEQNLPLAYSGHNSYADVRQPAGLAGPVLVIGYRISDIGYRNPGEFLDGCFALDSIVIRYDID